MALVGARLARRRGAAGLVALAVAGAVVVIGSLFGVAVVTADRATRQALAELPPRERAIAVNRHADSSSGADRADRSVREALGLLGTFTEPVLPATIFQGQFGSTSTVALDDVARWATVKTGRLPQSCDGGSTCEAVRISPFELEDGTGAIGSTHQLGEMTLTIVGIADLAPDLPLDPTGASGIVLLVDGTAATVASPLTAEASRTSFWIAPLDPDRTHVWVLDELSGMAAEVERTLAREDASFVVKVPHEAIAGVETRTATAAGRLVLIGSLVVSVLLAFAVFAAAVERRDVGLEYRRLASQGAGRRQLATFIAAEAFLPAVGGALIGSIAAVVVVAAIGLSQGAPVEATLSESIFRPAAMSVIALISLAAIVAVAIGIHPAAGRLLKRRTIATAVIPVVLVLVWDRIGRGEVDPAALAAQAGGPGTVLLPGLLGLTVILASLIVLPPAFRRIAGAAHGAPLAVRLATLSVAREPLRPAATVTLLAFSLGAAIFALTYAATLRQGAADQAAFAVGLDLRVDEIGTGSGGGSDVLPLSRYSALGADVEVRPVIRLDGRSATGRPLTVLGLAPRAITSLRGWRADFAASGPAQLAAAIDAPGDWRLPGHRLPAGARELKFDVDSRGDAIRLTAVIESDDGEYDFIPLGDLSDGRKTMRTELFDSGLIPDRPSDEGRGWSVVALFATNGGPAATVGGPDSGIRQQADVMIHGLEGLVDGSVPIHLDVSAGHARQLIRGASPTDGIALPAIVSPELAADVDSTGVLTVRVASGLDLRVRVAAIATRFPTMTEADRGLVVLDEAPLLVALNADAPGSGVPNEILLGTTGDARTAALAGALAREPFRIARLLSRSVIESTRADDPFAVGVVWALLVGAIAGVGLSVAGIAIGASTDLRDEGGESGDLEEQGLPPRSLERLAVLRTILLAGCGVATGAAVGIGLAWWAAASIAVTADGLKPIPPLDPVTPWLAIVALGMGLVLGLAAVVAGLARRHFAQGLVREARG